MTKTSQQVPVPQEKFASLTPSITPWNGRAIFKVASAAVFACALALAPAPAFAQHGGGGGGSHGGGGGGGARGGGSSAPAASSGAGTHATGGSSGDSHPANSTSSGSSGGHSWNPFHSSAAKPAAPAPGTNSMPAGNIKSEGSATNAPTHFAAANNTWVEPPKTAASSTAKVNYYGPANVNASRPYVPLSTTTRTPATTAHGAAVVAAQHPYQPIGPGYTYYPYYPYPYFGYNPYYAGFGFGWGSFGPCNPFWGCLGYGNGFGFGYGYGYGGGFGYVGGYPSGYNTGWTDESAEGSESKTSPDDPSSYVISANPSKSANTTASDELSDLPPVNADQQPTYVLLFLKDGSNFAVSDYWLSGGKLHYVTSYGGENAIDQSQLDLQRTVNENATRGVTFSLRPQPAAAPEPEKLQK
jgi:hypothetical protein